MAIGRRGKVSAEAKLDAVLAVCSETKMSIFKPDGGIRGKTDELWKKVSEHLGNEVSPSTIALDFSKDVHHLKTDFEKRHQPPISERPPSPNPDESFEDANSNDASITQSPAVTIPDPRKLTDEFIITIDPETWKLIQPVQRRRENDGRSYWVLGPEYRNVLFDAIWTTRKIQCCLCIERHTVVKGNVGQKKFVTICGYCNECKATFEVTMDKEKLLDDGSATFSIKIWDR